MSNVGKTGKIGIFLVEKNHRFSPKNPFFVANACIVLVFGYNYYNRYNRYKLT